MPWSLVVRRLCLAAVCLPLFLPCAAGADDIGPAQAQALQQQLRDWLARLLGQMYPLPDLPWRITGEHDHYQLTWPLPGFHQPADVEMAASLRPIEQNRWSIDHITAPAAATFTFMVPAPHDILAIRPVKVAFSIGKQDTSAVIDPGLATTSSLHSELADVALNTDRGKEHEEQRFDRYLLETSLTPTQDGRLDLLMDATMHGWKSGAQLKGGATLAIAAQRLRALGHVDGINREKIAALFGAAGKLIGPPPDDSSTKQDNAKLQSAVRAQLRDIVEALQDMLTAVSVEERIDRLQVVVAGLGAVSIKRLDLGLGGEAPDGELHAWLKIDVDGLEAPGLPAKFAAYLPHHLDFRPSLSGIQTADLVKLALDATEEGPDKARFIGHVMALALHGAKLGVDALAFDLGPAQIEGKGQVTMLSPFTWRGEAHLTASGLDDLTAQAGADPDAQRALPILILLRGLAKPDGNRLMWDIAINGLTVTVNGVELSQLGSKRKSSDTP